MNNIINKLQIDESQQIKKINQLFYIHIQSTAMFGSGISKNLKVIDFYKNVPSQYKEGTISGACISVVSITILVLLTISAFTSFFTPQKFSDLVIDSKHSQQKINVTIDIQFPRYPCSIMSLDIENVLKLHLVNINNNITKYDLPQNTVYSDQGLDFGRVSQNIQRQLNQKKGCRVAGTFEIDKVPGNFHFASHGYGNHFGDMMSQGFRTFDLSHKINNLYFGNEKPIDNSENVLFAYNSEKFIREEFLGITYTYFLQIVQKDTIYSNGYHREAYYYTVRINEIVLASPPMVFFQYQTNPMTQLVIGEYEQIYDLLVDLVAIIGGIFTVSSIVDQLVHSSIRFLLDKHRMGKLS